MCLFVLFFQSLHAQMCCRSVMTCGRDPLCSVEANALPSSVGDKQAAESRSDG